MGVTFDHYVALVFNDEENTKRVYHRLLRESKQQDVYPYGLAEGHWDSCPNEYGVGIDEADSSGDDSCALIISSGGYGAYAWNQFPLRQHERDDFVGWVSCLCSAQNEDQLNHVAWGTTLDDPLGWHVYDIKPEHA